MTHRRLLVSDVRLLVGAILVVTAVVVLSWCRKSVLLPHHHQQIRAVQNLRACMEALAEHPTVKPTLDDVNGTNLIGVEYSSITTTLGDLEAKRTSTNPDFGARLVRWFHEAGLDSGDVVACGCSGSFPALNVAFLCAAGAMDLTPVMIASVSASSYGANRPEFTYLDMETYLYNLGLIHKRSIAVSRGGYEDAASDLTEEGRGLLDEAIRRNGYFRIAAEQREENICMRAGLYFQSGKPKLFANIGGSWINVGDDDTAMALSPGIVRNSYGRHRIPYSMVEYFLQRGIPVLHLLNIKQIAGENAMPVDPVPLPEPGLGAVYFQWLVSSKIWAIAGMLIVCGWATLLLGKAAIRPEK